LKHQIAIPLPTSFWAGPYWYEGGIFATQGQYLAAPSKADLLDSAFLRAISMAASAVLMCLALLLVGTAIVPAYLKMLKPAITESALRHQIPEEWVAAILYNEILGMEDHILGKALPGDDWPSLMLRRGLLGWHFLTLKQAQLQAKNVLALLGANTTLGPASIRVSVGREIQNDVHIHGSRYTARGLGERLTLILDLNTPCTAVEYLAGNLARGRDQLGGGGVDWQDLARWQNTGIMRDSPQVNPRDWEKGSSYVSRVGAFGPEVMLTLGWRWRDARDAAVTAQEHRLSWQRVITAAN